MKGIKLGLMIVVLVAISGFLILLIQGSRKPDTSGQYVAMGSSFAAGIGLGPRESASPYICMRSVHGYPHLIAEQSGMRLVDVTCSGSTTAHILYGGQMFLGPQLAAIGPATQWVTITSGGNDVSYIGDLILASSASHGIGRLLRKEIAPIADRDFARVTENLKAIISAINKKSAQVKVVLVTYPNVVPAQGNCEALGVDDETVDIVRQVAAQLREATRLAAVQSGAFFVDMAAASEGHDVCSDEPWVNGVTAPNFGASFHPNSDGAKATAAEVMRILSSIKEP